MAFGADGCFLVLERGLTADIASEMLLVLRFFAFCGLGTVVARFLLFAVAFLGAAILSAGDSV